MPETNSYNVHESGERRHDRDRITDLERQVAVMNERLGNFVTVSQLQSMLEPLKVDSSESKEQLKSLSGQISSLTNMVQGVMTNVVTARDNEVKKELEEAKTANIELKKAIEDGRFANQIKNNWAPIVGFIAAMVAFHQQIIKVLVEAIKNAGG